MRLIIGISGASGVLLGYRLLQVLQQTPDCETHVVISQGAARNFICETALSAADACALADFSYEPNQLAARIASGSFHTDGMAVVPCSMKTVAAIAAGYAENLLLRAADVCLKEGRKVVLVPREMPLSQIHLANLTKLAQCGCRILPPVLTFYNGADSLEQQIDHIIGKVLAQFDLPYEKFKPWTGAN